MLGGSVAALSAVAGCASVVVGKRESDVSTYDLSAGVLRVDADYGTVLVREHEADGVRIRTEKRGSLFSSIESVTVTSRREGDAVIVGSRAAEGSLSNPPDVTIRITVPAGFVVESLTCGSGDASIVGVPVAAGTAITTENGDVELRGRSRSLELVGGRGIDLETENGDVEAQNVAGFVAGESTNGDLEIRGCDGIDGAATTNGDVEIDIAAVRGDTTIRSTNGDVEAALAPNLDVRVLARTTNGDVEAGASPIDQAVESDGYVEGSIGEPAHDLRLVTTNGDVELTTLGA